MVRHSWARCFLVVLGIMGVAPATLVAQTIGGRLLDADSGQPIDLGVLVLLTEEGDTAGLTASTADGRFSIAADEPGSFTLLASALGYAQREEGVFELGEDSRIDIEFRIPPRPMDLEGILVPTDAPVSSHPLIRNGFVRRYQRGLGHFLTPPDMQRTVYRDTESLFYMIPGVRVAPSMRYVMGGRAMLGPSTETVLMRNPFESGWCTPKVFVDGIRTQYRPGIGGTLSDLVPVGWIEAVEIYSRLSQVPPEYSAMEGKPCGVILFWLKR